MTNPEWREKGRFGMETSKKGKVYYTKGKDNAWRKAGVINKALARIAFRK